MEANGGLLSNNEVLAVLKDREADKPASVSKALPSEIKVSRGPARAAVAGCCLLPLSPARLAVQPAFRCHWLLPTRPGHGCRLLLHGIAGSHTTGRPA